MVGKVGANNPYVAGGWVIQFQPQDLVQNADFEIYHGSIKGPGGTFVVYIGQDQYGVAANGKINEYAPSIPMYVRKGQFIFFYWSISTTPAPQAWIYLRTPQGGFFS